MLTRLYENGLYLPARLRRGVSALWRETDGGGAFPCCCARGAGSSSTRTSTRSSSIAAFLTKICSDKCIGQLTATKYLVTIAGVANGSCTECTSVNGSYLMESVTTGHPSYIPGCKWLKKRSDGVTICGSIGQVRLAIGPVASSFSGIAVGRGVIYVRVVNTFSPLFTGFVDFAYHWDGGTPIDCTQSRDLPVTPPGVSICDRDGATCSISAVA